MAQEGDDEGNRTENARKRNGREGKKDGKERKAFAKPGALARKIKISAEKDERRARNPVAPVDRFGNDAAPKVVAVVGPRGSGKSTIIRSLVRHYTKRKIGEILGPMTMVSGRKRRLTLIEVADDLPSMMDAAKVADLIICVIDAHYGFEMETFEILNIAATHGMPNVMGVLTHLDKFRDGKQVKKVKKNIKSRFWTELYDGAKLFYFSGLTTHQDYLTREVLNLARFISVTKYKLVRWRSEHPYVLADRVEDLTDPSLPESSDKTVAAFGYVRGSSIRQTNGTWAVHVAGLGDLSASRVDVLPDPCPPAEGGYDHSAAAKRKKRVGDRDRVLYAPMSGELDGVLYDKDAVYITLPERNARFTPIDGEEEGGDGPDSAEENGRTEGERMVRDLQRVKLGIDERMNAREFRLMSDSGAPVEVEDRTANGGKHVHFDDGQSGQSGEGDSDESLEGEDSDGVNDSEESSEYGSEDGPEDDISASVSSLEEEAGADGGSGISTRTGVSPGRAGARNVHEGRSLARLVYGAGNEGPENAAGTGGSGSDEDAEGELFRKISTAGENDANRDCSKLHSCATEWLQDLEACKELRTRRFATGQGEAGAGDGAGSDLEDSDAVYGDFEDLETGEKFEADAAQNGPGEPGDGSSDGSDDEDLAKERLRTKQNFDAEYESRRTQEERGVGLDESAEAQRRRLRERREEALGALDDAARQEIEGILPGRYVRVELERVPAEFIRHFNPRYPVILGGLRVGDERKMLLRARVKRHRWKRGVLKSNDPVIISIGWRRYQTIPIYSLEDQQLRHRFLKYTPEHMHCFATFYGFSTPPGAGLVACQSLGRDIRGFRIAAMGVVTEVDAQFRIVKKLKLVGEPYKVHKNTAFIRKMFSSEVEVNKFIGAGVRTVSGIRGTIKKALRSSSAGRGGTDTGPPGSFRATFEDKLLTSDLVFLRAWVPIETKEFCSVATTLLEAEKGARKEASQWRMLTTRELRETQRLPIPVKGDSLYRPIERETRRFNPLKIPKKLEENLPYASRPKKMSKKREKEVNKDRVLVMEPQERRDYRMLQMLSTVKNERAAIRREAARERLKRKRKELDQEEEKHRLGEAKRRKKRYVTEGLRQKREASKQSS
mmetsp:Transcript_10256/g.31335  ORF Transcript_10256/g.31335 Transcript_10256/m.31335 type:complete len:1121 (-) Transcript_10256:367-3729(-)